MLIKEENLKHKSKISIYKELQDKKIIIPFFQREYVWKKENLEDFLNEIISKIEERSDKKIYLLRFIFSKTEKEGYLYIIDGQQRLVSLNLFIEKIIDYANKKNIDFEIKKFNIQSEDNDEVKYDFKKISDYFVSWIEDELDNDSENNKLKKIIKIIKEDIIIDYLEASSIDESFEIFNFVNSYGVKLTSKEIIISQIKKLIEEKKIKFKMFDDDKYKEKIEKYCSAYYFVKYAKQRSDNSNNKLAKLKFEEIKIMFREFKEDKEKFKLFLESLEEIKNQEQNNKIMINIIQNINRPQLCQIFYVIVFNNQKIKKYHDLFINLFLLSILMRFEKKNPGGIIINLYREISEKICSNEKIEKINEHFFKFIKTNGEFSISFDRFLKYLGSKKIETKIKKSFFLINFYLKNSDSNSSDFDIEHMMSKNKRNEGKIFKRVSTDNDEIKELTENIGNLILINSITNKRLSNKEIEEKIEIYKDFFDKNISYKIEMNNLDYGRLSENSENGLKNYILYRQKKIAECIYNFPSARTMIKKEEEKNES